MNDLSQPEEYAALAAAAQIWKRGIKIGEHQNHKGRGYGTVTIAAPIRINGEKSRHSGGGFKNYGQFL